VIVTVKTDKGALRSARRTVTIRMTMRKTKKKSMEPAEGVLGVSALMTTMMMKSRSFARLV